jgi:Arc/MetJ-type ribon-helix-helix transcriptional regulator
MERDWNFCRKLTYFIIELHIINKGIDMTEKKTNDNNTTIGDIKKTTRQVMQDLGDGIEQLASEIKTAFKGRNNTLMVRVDQVTLDRINQLVETEIFSSRSEAAAFLLSEGIKKQEPLFRKLNDSTEKIKDLRNSMKGIIAEELKEFKK